MINKKIISLIPLLEENKTDEIMEAIENDFFDIHEVSQFGSDLFKAAFYYNEFEVAKKLLNYKNNAIFSRNINKEVSTLLINNIIHNTEVLSDKMHAYTQFMVENKIELYPDFQDFIKTLIENNTNIEQLRKIENIECLKLFFANSVKEIKSLNSKDTIIEISQLQCPSLLQMYYDICEFDKLPIQEHPAFKLLKEVVTNPEQYYDYHIFSQEDYTIKDNINALVVEEIEDNFKKINTSKDFAKYFKKGRDFLPNIYRLQKMPFFDKKKYQSSIEVENIYSAIKILNDNILVENPDKFIKYYLNNWPSHYFYNKHTNKEELKSEYNSQLQDLINRYDLKSIIIHKDRNTKQVVDIIKASIKEIQKFFNLEDNDVGNNELNLIFADSQSNKSGEYQIESMTIRMFTKGLTEEEEISIVLHEYTHYLQFKDNYGVHKLNELKDMSKQWVDYSIKDFTKNLYNNFSNYYYMEEQKDNWLLLIEETLKQAENGNDFLNILKDKSSKLFKCILDSEDFKKAEAKHEVVMVDIYLNSQKNKEYSYETLLWKEYDNNRDLYVKNKNKKEYWNEPIEIHARLNQDLYLESINKIPKINPAKLKHMKVMIESFNELFTSKLKENQKKKIVINKKNIR